MAGIGVRLDWYGFEDVAQMLSMLPRGMRVRVAKKVVTAGSKPIQNAMKSLIAPVSRSGKRGRNAGSAPRSDTGALRQSITRTRARLYGGTAHVAIGPDKRFDGVKKKFNTRVQKRVKVKIDDPKGPDTVEPWRYAHLVERGHRIAPRISRKRGGGLKNPEKHFAILKRTGKGLGLAKPKGPLSSIGHVRPYPFMQPALRIGLGASRSAMRQKFKTEVQSEMGRALKRSAARQSSQQANASVARAMSELAAGMRA